MRRFRWRTTRLVGLGLVAVLLGGALASVGVSRYRASLRPARTYLSPAEYERWARGEFARLHPGEKPLNWRLAEAAVRLHRLQPMGKFVLGIKPGVWGNDCSDFVDAVADEAFGVKARCLRGSTQTLIGTDPRYFAYLPGDGKAPVQPGDLVEVRHSPWYEPNPDACAHVGIVGADGMVYDFAKLRSWSQARYGRTPVAWFVRHSQQPGEVLIGRLRPQYRYLIEPIPPPPAVSPAPSA